MFAVDVGSAAPLSLQLKNDDPRGNSILEDVSLDEDDNCPVYVVADDASRTRSSPSIARGRGEERRGQSCAW